MKSRILLISAISPTPQTSGGAVRIYHTITELSKRYQIDLITFDESNFKTKTKNIFDYIKYDIPYWFSPWYSQKLINNLKKILKTNKYDLIQVEFSQLLYLAKYLPKNIPNIFVSQDIASISFYRRIFENNPSIFKTILRWLLYLQIYYYEKKYYPLFKTVVTVSNDDQVTLQKQYPNKKIICIPNGIDKINFLTKTKTRTIKLGYIGAFSHTPNLNAVKYFINKIAPLLDKHNIAYKLYLAGDNDSNIIKKTLSNPNIINLGKVKETKDFYKKIDCLITPIFSGSGSRIKILESLSFGVPVISSSIGAEGININSKYLQIANNPNEYIRYLKNLPYNKFKNLENQLNPLLWKNIFKDYIY
jgi:glycosyltransferase involved in cell wall biosynthesis